MLSSTEPNRDAASLLARDAIDDADTIDALRRELRIAADMYCESLALLNAAYNRINDQQDQIRQLIGVPRE